MEEPRLRPAGFFHAPATPAPNSAPTGNVRLGRHAAGATSVLSRWKPLRVGMAPLTPTRGEHTGRGLGRKNPPTGASLGPNRGTLDGRGTHQRAQFAERPKRLCPQKIVMAHRQPIQRT